MVVKIWLGWEVVEEKGKWMEGVVAGVYGHCRCCVSWPDAEDRLRCARCAHCVVRGARGLIREVD